jgi:hypothetical protein
MTGSGHFRTSDRVRARSVHPLNNGHAATWPFGAKAEVRMKPGNTEKRRDLERWLSYC